MTPEAETTAWVDDIWRRGMAFPPLLPLDQWADRYRVLFGGPEPGPWRTARMPFLGEPMKAMTPGGGPEKVIIFKASQVGATELILNFVGSVVHQDPADMLFILPNTSLIGKMTTGRIDPLLEQTPALSGLTVPYRSRDRGNSATVKKFVGGTLYLAGANSGVSFRSVTAPYVLEDEVDAYPADVDGEGDPATLAERAARNFPGRRKIVQISTPTIRGFSRIERSLEASDKREYRVPCVHCGHAFAWSWRDVQWPKGEPEKAAIICPECGGVHTEADRQALIAADAGTWTPTAAGDGVTAGFIIGGLLSPWTSLAELARRCVETAKKPTEHRAFKNIWLGELWDDDAAAPPDSAGFLTRLEDFGDRLPAGIVAITAGVDVQSDRLEYELVGWGRGWESWSLDYGVIWGSPAEPATWDALDTTLKATFPHARNVPDMPIRAACVDSGGHHTQQVYSFAAKRQNRNVWAIKGKGGPGTPLWPRVPPRVRADGKVTPVILGVDAGKADLYHRLKNGEPGSPGYCHFPEGRQPEYFRQLTSETLVNRTVKGRTVQVWELQPNMRNEALDCRIYATAALYGLIAKGFRLDIEADRMQGTPPRSGTDGNTSQQVEKDQSEAKPKKSRVWKSNFLSGL